jgi:hypothetical protein
VGTTSLPQTHVGSSLPQSITPAPPRPAPASADPVAAVTQAVHPVTPQEATPAQHVERVPVPAADPPAKPVAHTPVAAVTDAVAGAAADTPLHDVTTAVHEVTGKVTDAAVDTPVRDVTTPVREVTTPVRDVTTPVRDVTTPVRDVTTPVHEVTTPVPDVPTTVTDAARRVVDETGTRDSGAGVDVPVQDEARTPEPIISWTADDDPAPAAATSEPVGSTQGAPAMSPPPQGTTEPPSRTRPQTPATFVPEPTVARAGGASPVVPAGPVAAAPPTPSARPTVAASTQLVVGDAPRDAAPPARDVVRTAASLGSAPALEAPDYGAAPTTSAYDAVGPPAHRAARSSHSPDRHGPVIRPSGSTTGADGVSSPSPTVVAILFLLVAAVSATSFALCGIPASWRPVTLVAAVERPG